MTDLPRTICGNGFHFIADGETVCACQLARTQELDVSARLQQLAQEKATLLKDMSKLACSYCDNVIEYDSPEARWTAEGRARAFDHILECPNRPELKLIGKLEASEAALAETREALHQVTERNAKVDELVRVALKIAGTSDVGSEEFNAMDELATSLGYEVP